VARRIDFYDDSAAPAANSLVLSVNVVVANADGDVLLIRRSDNTAPLLLQRAHLRGVRHVHQQLPATAPSATSPDAALALT
jgi:uncharacterized protein GlcG (DUF336 family)